MYKCKYLFYPINKIYTNLVISYFTGWAPLVFLFLVGCTARPFYPLPSRVNDGSRQPLQTFRPYNIAHRGSNGEIPEETAPAYLVNKGFPLFAHFISLLSLYLIQKQPNSQRNSVWSSKLWNEIPDSSSYGDLFASLKHTLNGSMFCSKCHSWIL